MPTSSEPNQVRTESRVLTFTDLGFASHRSLGCCVGHLADVDIPIFPVCLANVDCADGTEGVPMGVFPGLLSERGLRHRFLTHQPIYRHIIGVEVGDNAHQLNGGISGAGLAGGMEQADLWGYGIFLFTGWKNRKYRESHEYLYFNDVRCT